MELTFLGANIDLTISIIPTVSTIPVAIIGIMNMLIKIIHDWRLDCQIMKSSRSLLFGLFLIFSLTLANAQGENPDFVQGVRAFMNNEPGEALVHFEAALEQSDADPLIYLYLGLIYEQFGLFDTAIEYYTLGVEHSAQHRAQALFNIGNVHGRLENREMAIEYYNQAIQARRNFAPAYLNRAHQMVQTGDLQSAVGDYRLFIQFAPADPLNPRVREMISALEAELAAQKAQEAARLAQARQAALEAQAAADQAAREAEARIREAERVAREEEDRRRSLLDSVFSSLGSASSATSGIGGGAESVIEVDEEITIDGF